MKCLADVRATLGEGPVWVASEQALYWVDIPEKLVFRWSELEGVRTMAVEHHVCSLLPRLGGGFIGGGYYGFIAFDADFSATLMSDPEPELAENRFNDGKIDRAGRLWAGTMDRAEAKASGSLYSLDASLNWERVDSGYRVTNGPAFSRDGRVMYHTDSAIQTVYAFDIGPGDEVGERRVHLRFGDGDGYPDGMTIDAEDCLWVAFWDGWCVRRFAPSGELLATVEVPVQRPTSVAFGGAALDQLFITSAARDLTPEERKTQPQAGGLFVTRPGVTGIAELPFAG
jgi:sugar lactone lactonase YvrE